MMLIFEIFNNNRKIIFNLILLNIIFVNYYLHNILIFEIKLQHLCYLLSCLILLVFINFEKKFKYFISIIFLFFIIHTAFVASFNIKNSLSIIILISSFCLVYENYFYLKKNIFLINSILFHIGIFFLITLFFLILFNEIDLFKSIGYLTNFSCGGLRINDFYFVFRENSHVAIILTPLFFSIFQMKYSKTHMNILKLLYLFSIVFFFSLTMFIANFILVFLICIWKRSILSSHKFFFILLFFVLAYPMIMNKACTPKIIDFSYKNNIFKDQKSSNENGPLSLIPENDNQNDGKFVNISTFVYLYHIDLITSSIKQKPFGYGFNNYEYLFIDNNNDLTNTLNDIYKKYVFTNYNDGASNLIKILGEFGIISFLFCFFFLYFIFSNKFDPSYKILICSVLLIQFIRGAGYFNFNFLIYSCFLFILIFDKFFNIKHYKIR